MLSGSTGHGSAAVGSGGLDDVDVRRTERGTQAGEQQAEKMKKLELNMSRVSK